MSGPQHQESCISFTKLYEELISFRKNSVEEKFEEDEDLVNVLHKNRVNMMAQKDCFYFACKALDLNTDIVDSLPQQYVSCLPAMPAAEIEYERIGAEEDDAMELATRYHISPLISFGFSVGTTILFLNQMDDRAEFPWALFYYLGPNTRKEDETVGHWFKGSMNITSVQSFYPMQETDRVLEDKVLQRRRIKKARVGTVDTVDLALALLPPFKMQNIPCAKSHGLCRIVPAEKLCQLQENLHLKRLFPHLWTTEVQLETRNGGFEINLTSKKRAEWKKMTPSKMITGTLLICCACGKYILLFVLYFLVSQELRQHRIWPKHVQGKASVLSKKVVVNGLWRCNPQLIQNYVAYIRYTHQNKAVWHLGVIFSVEKQTTDDGFCAHIFFPYTEVNGKIVGSVEQLRTFRFSCLNGDVVLLKNM